LIPMQQEIFQQSDASICDRQSPINVASVPQRSPFRYPGGKTWFVPAFRRWLSCQKQRPSLLVEPFAGGATIGLTAVCENLVDHALLVELDPDIAAVWHVLAHGDAPQLAERILTFDLTLENVKIELSKVAGSTLDTAFKTILKNRTYHGGILAAGSGLIKSGEAGKGITSRWYPMTLSKRLQALHLIRHRLTVLCEDALGVLAAHADDSKAIFFVDPPYTAGGKKAGKRLYNYNELNHSLLFDACHSLNGDFVMTYDDAAEAHDMASSRGFDTRMIAMKNTHHAQMTELVIGRNLAWLD
jgi:DNA adenine methylase